MKLKKSDFLYCIGGMTILLLVYSSGVKSKSNEAVATQSATTSSYLSGYTGGSSSSFTHSTNNYKSSSNSSNYNLSTRVETLGMAADTNEGGSSYNNVPSLSFITDMASSGSSKQMAVVEDSYEMEEAVAESDMSDTYRQNAKLIRNVSMSLNTKNEDLLSIFEDLEERVKELDGYSQNQSINTYTNSVRGDIDLRIPAGNVDTFLAYIDESDLEIVRINDSTTDVTLEYSDTNLRLEVLEAQRKKYMEYLEMAESVEDIMQIERDLQDVIYDIESTTSRLNILSDKITYSTITIHIEYSKYEATSIRGKIGQVCYDTMVTFGDSIVQTIEFFATVCLPVMAMVVMAVIAVRMFIFLFKVGKKGKDKVVTKERKRVFRNKLIGLLKEDKSAETVVEKEVEIKDTDIKDSDTK